MPKPTYTIDYPRGFGATDAHHFEQALSEATNTGYVAGMLGLPEIPELTLRHSDDLSREVVASMREQLVQVARVAYDAGVRDARDE